MWKCKKCQLPVYFAERRQSLGYDWHPECLRCNECEKVLSPGQHAEHKGVPYCHVPCYGALFGPQLYGHGTRVESHKSFGQKPNNNNHPKDSNVVGVAAVSPTATGGATASPSSVKVPNFPREILETKLKVYNDFFGNRGAEVRSREKNGRLILEGALRVYWGVHGVIQLKEDDDQRTVVTIRKRNSCRFPVANSNLNNRNSDTLELSDNSELTSPSLESDISVTDTFDTTESSFAEDSSASTASSKEVSPAHNSSQSVTLPSKLNVKDFDWDEIDELLQVERKVDEGGRLYQTMPSPLPSQTSLDSLTSSISTTTTTTSSSSNDNNNSPTTTTEHKKNPGNNDADDVSTSLTSTQADSSTLVTPNPTSMEDYETASESNTLKACDFEDFKKQISEEYINGANDMFTQDENTLKSNQPIDMSRINDSLKLYQENIMSKSFHGLESGRNYAVQKSGSATLRSHIFTEDDSWIDKSNILNRSRSGPNCFGSNFIENDDATLRPSTIKKLEQPSVNIKMDCYNDLGGGGGEDGDRNNGATNSAYYDDDSSAAFDDEVVLRRPRKAGSAAIKRRSGNRRSRTKLKRRCSINGHFYNRETSVFTPPHGSQMSVYVSSMVTTQDVVNLLLEKYKVESRAENFTLFIIRDNGEQRRLREDDFPLVVRIMLGPHEDVAKLYLVDAQYTPEISSDVAQFLNLSIPECRSILDRYSEEQEREIARIKERYTEMKNRITQRMESLKVRL